MWPFLRDRGHFIANLQARQTGKTFNGMAKLLWYAFRYPGSLILVTAPKFDQVKRIAFRALDKHLERMRGLDASFFDYVVGRRNILKTVIRFRNGWRRELRTLLTYFPERKRGWRKVFDENRKGSILFIIATASLLLLGAWFEVWVY